MTIISSYSRRKIFHRNLYNVLIKAFSGDHQIRTVKSSPPVTDAHSAEVLSDRGLLHVSGAEVTPFMQGLITNDMRHLEDGSRSMYTMFLNSKGRIMYDAIIYRDPIQPAIYIECDKLVVSDLERHLKMFKVRRKIDISIVENYRVWVLYSPTYLDRTKESRESDVRVKDFSQEKVLPCQAVDLYNTLQEDEIKIAVNLFSNKDFCVSTDPRLAALGVRIIAKNEVDVKKFAQENGILIENVPNISHKTLRYSFGIAEGTNELPYGKCFPLEMNCDYLHGVSFHKGCYIGQELTARTHHTGVVRKRLMPIYLDSTVNDGNQLPTVDTPVEAGDDQRKTVGKLRGIENNVAIGLLRISDALSATTLNIGSLTGYTIKPLWWPQEAPKENLLSKKK